MDAYDAISAVGRFTLIAILLAWLLVASLAGWLADQRGRPFAVWMLLGLAFGPLAIITVGLAPVAPSGRFMPCEDCKEPTRPEAAVCPHCGRDQMEDVEDEEE